MVLYYAVGGGLGHITRARAVLHTLQPQVPAVILCSSLPVARFPLPDGVQLRVVPSVFARAREAYRTWLRQLFAETQPQVVFLDTFPVGIVGEFCDFPMLTDVPVHYVARRLRWNTYARQIHGGMPAFQTTFALEPLEDAHQEFVTQNSQHISMLSLLDPPSQLSHSEGAIVEKFSTLAEPFWLIVHAGGNEEVHELIAYADERQHHEASRARLVVATPERNVPALPATVQTLGFFPAQTLFPFAERVISGCGFNVMRQMSPFRQKHAYLPFARRFDDQYWRAAYWGQR